jgi:hypothetical protein
VFGDGPAAIGSNGSTLIALLSGGQTVAAIFGEALDAMATGSEGS